MSERVHLGFGVNSRAVVEGGSDFIQTGLLNYCASGLSYNGVTRHIYLQSMLTMEMSPNQQTEIT